MKKLSIIALFAIASFTMTAQDGPKAGDWAIGLSADGVANYLGRMFTSGNTFSLGSYPTINLKKFTKDNEAYRANLNLAVTNTSSGSSSNMDYNVQVGLGKEFRKGTGKLQGFYGAMPFVGFAGGSMDNGVNTTTTKPTFSLGAKAFIGAEYFVFSKLAIGAELQYGLSLSTGGGVDTKVNASGVSTTTKESTTTVGIGSSSYVPMLTMNLYF